MSDELRVQALLDQGFVEVCSADRVGPVMPLRVELAGRGVLVCRDGERLYALDELCPHKQKSMAYGLVMEGRLTCPHHQYSFELATGRCDQRRCEPVHVYSVELVQGRVFLRV